LTSDGKLRRRQLLRDSAAGAEVEVAVAAAVGVEEAERPGIRTRHFRRSSDQRAIRL
jgi:hypothetical protein